ncbi:general substrate transporter [Syncephalis pseudoplumigaleata]|uniref:General substrate transporter n=1 Tax=Syncephalis pseudoplumigaleata TaxID=1712513 RepID=A0A4P9YZZ4_9FUNG|nr:general substrate transporter [Syncephalis pseudoplumigaleata]|eukprot:RKP25684.1 general substrate transporter [Syncephalis pseudoplumigaleata]
MATTTADNTTRNKRGEAGHSGEADSREATWTMYSFFCASSAALSAFNNGYNIGSPNAPELVIRACQSVDISKRGGTFPGCTPMSTGLWGFAIGGFALGGLLGSFFLASPLMSRIGRRNTLIVSSIIYVVAGLLMALSPVPAQLIVGRIVVGIATGIGSVTAPVYVGEVATIKRRGMFGSLIQLFLVVGILVAQVLGLVLSTAAGWRLLLGLTIVPAVIQALMLCVCVESPPSLAARGRTDAATAALMRLRKGYDTTAEMDAIIESQKRNETDGEASMSMIQLLKSPMRKIVFIAFAIHALQQLTGINSVFFYSTGMFTGAFGAETARAVTVGIGALNVGMTFVSSALVERAGRKSLVLASLAGMTLMSLLVVLGSIFHQNVAVIVAVFLFVAVFAIGLGPIPWLILPELFPTKAVGAASSMAIAVNWLCNCCVSLLFPLINEGLESYSYLVFVVTGAVGFIFIWYSLTDTKGKTVEQVQAELLGHSNAAAADPATSAATIRTEKS